MRILIGLLLALGACSAERQSEQQSAVPDAAPAGIPAAAAARAQSSPLMAIPEDPEALKRLEAMGYTIHAEQNHLHAPGVASCPQMGENPVM